MANPLILTLDIATRTGWALGRLGETPRHGSIRLAPAGSSNGAIGCGLLRWAMDFLALERPDAVYYEVPIDPRHMGGGTNFATTRILVGLPFLAETIFEARGIFKVHEVEVQKVRKHFTGEARPKNKKAAVIASCRARDWRPVDDNAADALAIWSFATDREQRLLGAA